MINEKKDLQLAVIGLGYVGLPLALEFAKKRKVIGFDINKNRIEQLSSGKDKNLEFSKEELQDSKKLNFTNSVDDIKSANCYIVTVPTPIDEFKKPDLRPLFKASEIIGKIIKKGDLIIYESTVYPGCVEEECVPVLEKFSELKFNQDFFCGYSPERINPGDKAHTISNIKKITSGSTPKIADLVDDLYNEIIKAGTHKAPSIKVAEAAKVIENTQRDVNIALINELSKIFNKLNIDTQSVLDAASTKWNFLPFSPGLVGGHCIGVDPYYLTYKAKSVGYTPEIILAGRRINDSMGSYIAQQVLILMKHKSIEVVEAKILIMGLTFKENCPDLRNSKVIDLVNEFENLHCNVEVFDPWVSKDEVENNFNITIIEEPVEKKYDCIILAVAHDYFKKIPKERIKSFVKNKSVIYDVKHLLEREIVDGRL